ncbi:enolase [Opitutaceae bacterium TAV5]|nr:enolase [Opitutaceae bacterium TAV5]
MIAPDELSFTPDSADPSPSLEICLQARGVTKAFSGVPALRDGRLNLRTGTVHALCGGNGAGKSTLLGILMGLLRRDSGSVRIGGEEVDFEKPGDALEAGIAIVTQELSPVPGMTVAENIYLGREPHRLGCLVDYRTLNRQAAALLDRLGFRIGATRRMTGLSLAETQLVEIAKALSRDSRIVIMDEPTSAIGQHETDLLFAAIRHLTRIGKSIIYVTHRMTEIFELADDYTVLRDGAFIEEGRIRDIDRRHLIRQIIGRDLSSQFRSRTASAPGSAGSPSSASPFRASRSPFPASANGDTATDTPLLEVRHFECPGRFGAIDLQLRAGEIVGLYGLLGSGRSEFLQALFGLEKGVRGELRAAGRPLLIRHPKDAMRHRMALVTEDRKASGLVLPLSVRDNLSLSSLGRVSSGGFVNKREELRGAREMVERFRIKAASINMTVRSMSGGNQQKVVLGRWFRTQPQILLLDEPTRGIDEGAKHEIYQFMTEFTQAGGAIIMVSSEVDEVLGMADRIFVFRRGLPAAACESGFGESAKEDLMHMASP